MSETNSVALATSETRFATNRGQRIAYDVTGDGPAVVLQHWLLGNRRAWHTAGYVAALADAYRVICIDSLGHGDSDKPVDQGLYGRAARAGDVAAVLDAAGVARAHLIGYSMGGWMGMAMLQLQPERLLSAVIGGWDPVSGMGSQPAEPADFDGILEKTAVVAPQMTAWVTDEIRPAVRACFDVAADLDGAEAALRVAEVPILFWVGREDGPFEPVRQLAGEIDGVEFLEVPGTHGGALFVHARESVTGLRNFLDRVEQREARRTP